MVWIDSIEAAIAWYRDRLGFAIAEFGRDAEGRPGTCLASYDGASLLITRDPAMALGGAGQGSGHARLYFHLGPAVDGLHDCVKDFPDVEVAQGPTDQWWGDRTVILRDPWGTVLVFANSETE
jgi:hypothetical protein